NYVHRGAIINDGKNVTEDLTASPFCHGLFTQSNNHLAKAAEALEWEGGFQCRIRSFPAQQRTKSTVQPVVEPRTSESQSHYRLRLILPSSVHAANSDLLATPESLSKIAECARGCCHPLDLEQALCLSQKKWTLIWEVENSRVKRMRPGICP